MEPLQIIPSDLLPGYRQRVDGTALQAAFHPFEDGNGRAGRLLEKWFIAEKLGAKAWYLQSELHYYIHVG